mmetsp:Transcript_36352/g.84572  ORF Transcript_36352/g.84572 Transcript_36352/m.84572 type:complete len:85 (-) Transcript_36352:76-330(-)
MRTAVVRKKVPDPSATIPKVEMKRVQKLLEALLKEQRPGHGVHCWPLHLPAHTPTSTDDEGEVVYFQVPLVNWPPASPEYCFSP